MARSKTAKTFMLMVDRTLSDFPSSTSLFYTRSNRSYLEGRWANSAWSDSILWGEKAKNTLQ